MKEDTRKGKIIFGTQKKNKNKNDEYKKKLN